METTVNSVVEKYTSILEKSFVNPRNEETTRDICQNVNAICSVVREYPLFLNSSRGNTEQIMRDQREIHNYSAHRSIISRVFAMVKTKLCILLDTLNSHFGQILARHNLYNREMRHLLDTNPAAAREESRIFTRDFIVSIRDLNLYANIIEGVYTNPEYIRLFLDDAVSNDNSSRMIRILRSLRTCYRTLMKHLEDAHLPDPIPEAYTIQFIPPILSTGSRIYRHYDSIYIKSVDFIETSFSKWGIKNITSQDAPLVYSAPRLRGVAFDIERFMTEKPYRAPREPPHTFTGPRGYYEHSSGSDDSDDSDDSDYHPPGSIYGSGASGASASSSGASASSSSSSASSSSLIRHLYNSSRVSPMVVATAPPMITPTAPPMITPTAPPMITPAAPTETSVAAAAASRDEPNFTCTICLENWDKPIVLKVCGHVFCNACIDDWLKKKNQCPTCKKTAAKSDMIKIYV
jgi:hypothetical protein